jgi:hypothetical protein
MPFPQENAESLDQCSLGGSKFCFHQFGILRQVTKDHGRKLDTFIEKFDEFLKQYNADQIKMARDGGINEGAGKTKANITAALVAILSSGAFVSFLSLLGVHIGK